MQIIAELDNQHIEKLQALEKSLKISTSELISFAIDEVYGKQKPAKTSECQKAYQIMQESGFIGSIEGGEDLAGNYKQHLDWDHKL